jgi:hypothetical protein
LCYFIVTFCGANLGIRIQLGNFFPYRPVSAAFLTKKRKKIQRAIAQIKNGSIFVPLLKKSTTCTNKKARSSIG